MTRPARTVKANRSSGRLGGAAHRRQHRYLTIDLQPYTVAVVEIAARQANQPCA